MTPEARATIDLAVRVWLGIAPMSEVQDWVDARLAGETHPAELTMRLAENRNRERHEVAADLLAAPDVPRSDATTHAIIVALGEAFERGELPIRAASRFLRSEIWDRMEAMGRLSDAYTLEDALDLAEGGLFTGHGDAAVAMFREIVSESRRPLET